MDEATEDTPAPSLDQEQRAVDELEKIRTALESLDGKAASALRLLRILQEQVGADQLAMQDA